MSEQPFIVLQPGESKGYGADGSVKLVDDYKGTGCAAVFLRDEYAAAPELLAALKQLREWVRRPWGADDSPANEQVIDEADTAIAKAEKGTLKPKETPQ